MKEEYQQILFHIVNTIGNGELLLEWALILFPPPSMKKRKMNIVNDDYCQYNTINGASNDIVTEYETDEMTTMATVAVANNPNHGNNTQEDEEQLAIMRDLYVSMLSTTLSYCTGIKSRSCAMSPVLSRIAFQSNLMEQLWCYVKTQLELTLASSQQSSTLNQEQQQRQSIKAFSSAATFCDLFVHHLLAMDDEEFLLSYTTQNQSNQPRSSIVATELIQVLNTNLYALYWSKPVLVDDVMLPSSSSNHSIPLSMEEAERCHRARFLLSGTKLWNALHQRWSRLFATSKFCEQECWYFPRLVTREKDEDGAVFGTRMESLTDVDMDDNDDENSTASMDIDEDDNSNVRGRTVTAVDEENDALASSFKDPKMARILTSIPQAIPFDRRVKLFNSLLTADLARAQDETQAARSMMFSMMRGEEGAEFQGRIPAKIHRDRLYEDSMDQLNKLGPKLRKKLSVTFYNQGGAVEAGIDGGGVFREFLDDLIKEAFNPGKSHGNIGPLFTVSPMQTLSVNTSLEPTPEILSHYQFLGRVLGKAVYESLLVEPQFSNPFLNQLLGQQNTLDDLKNVDPEYHKHLSILRKMNGKDIEALGLTFELSAQRTDGRKSHTIELIPGGSSTNVTKQNAIRYVHLVAHRRLNIESAKQTNAFLRGFRDLIPAAWVRLFSPYELQRLISGDDTVKGFDVLGLKEAMQYGGGYHPSQAIMQWFWEIIENMTPDQQRKFLKFMTSCSRQPLLGFKSLAPLPCIHQIRLSEEEHSLGGKDLRLPTSATCMNLLKLPNYKTKELLKTKLLYAIEAGAGFELS
jgi:ubiquitin-protein ligase E3 C